MQQTPLTRYEHDIQQLGYARDGAQQRAVERLEALYHALLAREAARPSLLARWLGRDEPPAIQSVYLWGGVGRGKTYLMDTFYDTLPFARKMRTHFHRFMRRVHAELTVLSGERNPLEKVAARLAEEAQVICFDEFFVTDISDAMILANLLRGLFARNVVLVMTSNIEPSGLYQDGLQRERFLPAIRLLQTHADVLNVDGGTDYRLRELKRLALFHSPNDHRAEASMLAAFKRLVPDAGKVSENAVLAIEGRNIHALRESDDVVWFAFAALCDGPRSQHDYIVLAKEYHTVLISDVPALGAKNDDQARRFVYLVDEFYDRRVKLILSAERPLLELYGDGKLRFEFERTQSRLLEMQSEEYLASPHRP